MDRNLGAIDIYYHGDSHYGDLYYQFGRKDPFSGPRKIYILKEDGSYSFETWSTSTYTIQNTAADADCKNVPYSIKNPLTFIKGTYWTYNDIYNPTVYDSTIRWQDPYVKDDTGKSMFDPCPAGWKIPKASSWNIGKINVYWLMNNPLSPGCNYFPNGVTDRTTGTIFCPYAGRIAAESGDFGMVGSYFFSWCSDQTGSAKGLGVHIYSASYPSFAQLRALGTSVRCVQE